MEKLWERALDVLDNHDVTELYKFEDETGILAKHRNHFEHVSGTNQQEAKAKDFYFELIKMMMDQDLASKPDPQKRKDIKEVRKIQGYQDLTNKLLRRTTQELVNNYVILKDRMDRIEGLLGVGSGDFVLKEKLDNFEDRLSELQMSTRAKLEELREEDLNHNTRLGGLENDVIEIKDKIKGREDLDLVEAEQARIEKELIEALEKRVDVNETNLDLLMENDKRQDDAIQNLEQSLPSLDNKLKALESADEFFQEAHKDMVTRAQTIEDDGKKMGINIKELADAFDHYKHDKDITDEKVQAKLEMLAGEDMDIRKRLDEFMDEQEKINEKQNKDLDALENDVKTLDDNLKNLATDQVDGKEKEMGEFAQLKKDIHEVADKVRQLEGISNENADVINKFTLNQFTYNERFNDLESDAHEMKDRVLGQLEDCRKDINHNSKELEQLGERVKYNYDRLDHLTDLPNKVQALETFNEENNVNIRFLRDQTHRIESTLNSNNERISIEIDERQRADDNLASQIDKMKREAEALMAKLEDAEEDIKRNLEKIVGLEELNAVQQEKAVYVESLASRVSAIDEQKQQSEAKLKEELETTVKGNKDAIESLYKHFNDRLDEVAGSNHAHSGELKDLKNKSKQLEEDVERLRDEARHLVDAEIEILSTKLKEKTDEVDGHVKTNERHVENLRELNKKLLDDLEASKLDNLKKMDEKLDAIRREIPHINVDDFGELVEARFKMEAKLNELNERAKIIGDELDATKKDLEGKHTHTHTMIHELHEKNESILKTLEEKVTIIERAQNENNDELRKYVDDLKAAQEKAEVDLEGQIRSVDEQTRQGIDAVEQRVEDKAKTIQKHYEGLRIDLDIHRRDLWTIFLEMYGTMRCYTVVMKSTGSAAEHQSACLGIYRSIDWLNDRPVYKQDDGENYLYYNAEHKAWMVASHVGNDYAWMRYQLRSDGEESSSSSSSSSSSDSDGESDGDKSKKKKKKTTTSALEKKYGGTSALKRLVTPDLFNPGWEYKMSPLKMTPEEADLWMTDDASLRLLPLGDVEKISDVIREIRNEKEID